MSRIQYKTYFQLSLRGLNSKFSFSYSSSHTKVKDYSLPDYLLIAGERIVKFIPFLSTLMLCEIQIASVRI